jgi:hypothetical protein
MRVNQSYYFYLLLRWRTIRSLSLLRKPQALYQAKLHARKSVLLLYLLLRWRTIRSLSLLRKPQALYQAKPHARKSVLLLYFLLRWRSIKPSYLRYFQVREIK